MQVCLRPSGAALLAALLVALCGRGLLATNLTDRCTIFQESVSERSVLRRLESLTNRNFSVNITSGKERYTYVFQLCGDADGVPGAGVVQKGTDSKATVIGRYNATQAIGGSDWVMLIYRGGERYDGHCTRETRKAIVMISCNRKTAVGSLEVVLEDRERVQDCFYLFELDSSTVCPAVESHLSTGSVILIIMVCLLALYLIGGFLYQRLVVGAKGVDQFPNRSFWVEVGNLSADGCDFICRSKPREEAPTYRGVTAEPLEEEPDERDDHLLPM